MAKKIKKYCLIVLTLCPVAAVSFAAQSSLNVAQIRNGVATDSALQASNPLSPAEGDAEKK
ncbi:MAG TPA: hypothetical protein DCZ92_06095 [Elusimicrobia bacterium]|nr:hypothetical protein [Elusimicrobiota bacterium]